MMSSQRFPRTWKVIEAGLAQGVAPGFVIGIWCKQNPNQMDVGAWGARRVVPSVQPMLPETIFDLSSITKIFATSVLAAVLVDRGWLSWDTEVRQVLPQYPYPNICVRHLLSHTSGLAAWRPFWKNLREQFGPIPLYEISLAQRQRAMWDLVRLVEPEGAPEKTVLYSDLNFIILGFLLERIVQMPLDEAVRFWVWLPMGIPRAYFRRIRRLADRDCFPAVAATEECTWRGGVLQGQVHDDNCWAMGGYGGHAGAFGTVYDLLHFAKVLLMTRFLSPATLTQFWTRASRPMGCDRTLGWDTPSSGYTSLGQEFSRCSVGHLGFTGTSFWIDLEAQMAVAVLSNRVHPHRENTKIREFRPLVHDAIRLDLKG